MTSNAAFPFTVVSANESTTFLSRYQVVLPPAIADLTSTVTTTELSGAYQPNEYDVVCGRGKVCCNRCLYSPDSDTHLDTHLYTSLACYREVTTDQETSVFAPLFTSTSLSTLQPRLSLTSLWYWAQLLTVSDNKTMVMHDLSNMTRRRIVGWKFRTTWLEKKSGMQFANPLQPVTRAVLLFVVPRAMRKEKLFKLCLVAWEHHNRTFYHVWWKELAMLQLFLFRDLPSIHIVCDSLIRNIILLTPTKSSQS